jgi:MscS family membrane protein
MNLFWHALLTDYIWLVKLGVFLLLILFVNICLKQIILHFKRRAKYKEHDWRTHLDYVFLTPLHTLLWILFAALLISLVAPLIGIEITSLFFSMVRNSAVIGCMAWFFLRWKKVFQRSLSALQSRGKLNLDTHSIQIMGKVFSFIVIFISLLIILQVFGLDVLPLIAFGGIGAAAAGFASKEVIANFFGGLMVHLTRPFVVGELIELPGKKILGYIEEIGWYYTSIRDLQKKPIFIPNSMFSIEIMINQSRMTHRRIEEVISVRYEDAEKVPLLVKKIRELFTTHPGIDLSQSLYVSMTSFAAASIDMEIKAYTRTADLEEFLKIKQEILLKIYDLILSMGANIPTGLAKFFEKMPKMDS